MKTKTKDLTTAEKQSLMLKAFPDQPDRVSSPKRLQRKNYMEAIPQGAKVVHRPSRWGNPFSVKEHGRSQAIQLYETWVQQKIADGRLNIAELIGFDLVCFCRPDEACHADVLLRLVKEHQQLCNDSATVMQR
jgi:hypothetical protein